MNLREKKYVEEKDSYDSEYPEWISYPAGIFLPCGFYDSGI
jgi:hypothetical protein